MLMEVRDEDGAVPQGVETRHEMDAEIEDDKHQRRIEDKANDRDIEPTSRTRSRKESVSTRPRSCIEATERAEIAAVSRKIKSMRVRREEMLGTFSRCQHSSIKEKALPAPTQAINIRAHREEKPSRYTAPSSNTTCVASVESVEMVATSERSRRGAESRREKARARQLPSAPGFNYNERAMDSLKLQ